MKDDSKIKKDFLKAVETGDVSKVAELLKSGVHCDFRFDDGYIKDLTPLMLACLLGKIEIIKLLVNRGADINAKTISESGGAGDRTPLAHAVIYSENGKTACDMVQFLLENGADPKIANNTNCTPIEKVVAAGRFDLFDVFDSKYHEKILEYSDIKALVYFSAQHSEVRVLKKLLSYGGDVNPGKNDEYIPLFAAASSCSYEALELLLMSGAIVSVIDGRGRSALHAVAEFSRDVRNQQGIGRVLNAAQMLVRSGIDVNLIDQRGITALDHANLAKFPDLALFLKSVGARYGALTKSAKQRK